MEDEEGSKDVSLPPEPGAKETSIADGLKSTVLVCLP